jgi:hypothetical protein
VAGHAVTVRLDWVPQRVVWIALWLSLAGGLACLLIVAATARARRRSARVGSADTERLATAGRESITARPVLLEAALAPRTTRATALVVVTLALAAGVLVRPWAGILVGGLAFWSLRERRVRLLVRYAPAAIMIGVAIYMAGAQAVHHYTTGTGWPAAFAPARIPTWIALFLLLTDTVIEHMWRNVEGPA